MSRAISVGKNAMRHSYPNPMVGCVIVYENKIISEGFTSSFGGPHAEANALNSLKDKTLLSKATLYVTLEPCAHYGNTPPCTNLIIAHKIPRVVIGVLDPNPKVSGKGIALLEASGSEVIVGVLSLACKWHHRRFLILQEKKRPYIILKWAQSADAFIAPPSKGRTPYWISSAISKQRTHQWRSQEHAILIGANTLLDDRPSLDVRLWQGLSPVPIYIDRDLSIAPLAPLFKKHTKIFCITSISSLPKNDNNVIVYLAIDFNMPIALQITNLLYKQNIMSLIVEGGAKTLANFIDEGLWDEARVFKSSHLLKRGIEAPEISGKLQLTETMCSDVLEVLVPHID